MGFCSANLLSILCCLRSSSQSGTNPATVAKLHMASITKRCILVTDNRAVKSDVKVPVSASLKNLGRRCAANNSGVKPAPMATSRIIRNIIPACINSCSDRPPNAAMAKNGKKSTYASVTKCATTIPKSKHNLICLNCADDKASLSAIMKHYPTLRLLGILS